MNAFTELYGVISDPLEQYTGGLQVYAYKTYSGYSDALEYGVGVMNLDTLDDIDDAKTTFEQQEDTFNAMLRKYGIKNAKFDWI